MRLPTPASPPLQPREPLDARVLLILPCNRCVRWGDYMLCSNWRLAWAAVWDLYMAGHIYLAAIDSCKPGIVLWGEERWLRHCDLYPSSDLYYRREPWRLEVLYDAVLRDLRDLITRYEHIVYYVNVKAYREALRRAAHRFKGRLVEAGPERDNPLSYRSRRERLKMRLQIEKLLGVY